MKRLILWSDSCRGQNRNVKLTLMLKALLNYYPTLQTISLRFLEFRPGFPTWTQILAAIKLLQRLYTPEDYMQII